MEQTAALRIGLFSAAVAAQFVGSRTHLALLDYARAEVALIESLQRARATSQCCR